MLKFSQLRLINCKPCALPDSHTHTHMHTHTHTHTHACTHTRVTLYAHSEKNFFKNLKKGVDNSGKVCYPLDVLRNERTAQAQQAHNAKAHAKSLSEWRAVNVRCVEGLRCENGIR